MPPLFQIYAVVSERVPLSINACYTTFRNRRILTKAGEAFKSSVTAAVSRECIAQPWAKAVEAVYLHQGWAKLTVVLHGSWMNASWKPGRKTDSGKLQSPYQKKDATNFIKLIEDAVADGTGIDDSANFDNYIGKRQNDQTYVELVYEVFPWPPS